MITQMQLTIGTGGEYVFRTGLNKPEYLANISRPTFLARARGALYGVSEVGHGKIFRMGHEAIMGGGGAVPIGGLNREPLDTGLIGAPIASGGVHPCHIAASPDGGWLYVSNYGNGVVRAVELGPEGELGTAAPIVTGDLAANQGEAIDRNPDHQFGQIIDLAHSGNGPDPMRQSGPHAHYAQVVQGWLVVADLGTDQLRVYELDGYRPTGQVELVDLPAGSGPRHFARRGERLIVAGELDGLLTEVEIGTWRVGRSAPASRAAGEHYLSHVLAVDNLILVGVRGANTLSVLSGDLEILAEVDTVNWPRHFAYAKSADAEGIVVAGERNNEIGWHEFRDGKLSGIKDTLRVPAPMFIGIGDQF